MILTLAITIGFRDTTLIGNAYGNLFIYEDFLCLSLPLSLHRYKISYRYSFSPLMTIHMSDDWW